MATQYLTSSTKALERVLALIRQNADEPVIDAKYSDDDLLLRVEAAYQIVLSEINVNNDAPILSRHNISLATGTATYMLPPNAQSVTRIAKINATTGQPEWYVTPLSRWGPAPGIRFEGRVLRFEPTWLNAAETVEMTYIPNGDVRLHYGTAAAVDSTSVTLTETPTLGDYDDRANAYVGSVLRILSSGAGGIQERTVTAMSSKQCIVDPAWSPSPSGTTVYEIVPLYGRLVESVVAAYVARDLQRINRNKLGVQFLNEKYMEERRATRLQVARINGILGLSMEHDTLNWGS